MEKKKNNAVEKVENVIREKNYSGKEGEIYVEKDDNMSKDVERESIVTKDGEKDRKMSKNRENRKKERGKRGYITAIICLGVATLALSSILTYNYLTPSESDRRLNSSYERAFYDTVEEVNNIDLNLSKVLVTKDQKTMQEYLVNLAINSELAESTLQELPLKDENKYYTGKLINQIGDYAKYLNKKLINGEALTKEEMESLAFLRKANLKLKEMLSQTMENMDEDFSFNNLKENGENIVLDNFNQLENTSVELPELIYDGPFSDAKNTDDIKLSGAKINQNEARDIFIKIFDGYKLKNIVDGGESTGKIECFCFSAEVNGDILYAQISKIGGKLIMSEFRGSCNDTKYQEEAALQKATEFIDNLGLKDMKKVWGAITSNEYVFNFVYEKEGVLVYPDMVKVRVCAETNMVIGFEGVSYYSNHCERVIDAPKISRDLAREEVFDSLDIVEVNTALVKKGNAEKLCYEFEGVLDGDLYYVYIDANTGRQVEMFKVISTKDGTLLA